MAMKFPQQVVYTRYKSQVRYSLGSNIMKSCTTVQQERAGREQRGMKQSWRDCLLWPREDGASGEPAQMAAPAFAWSVNTSSSVTLRRFQSHMSLWDAFFFFLVMTWWKAKLVLFPVVSETPWELMPTRTLRSETRYIWEEGEWKEQGEVFG